MILELRFRHINFKPILIEEVSQGGRTGLPARVSGRHVVLGRQFSPVPAQASRVSVTVRGCARVTGKAGENGQYSGVGRQLTLDKTVGSRVW